MILFLFSCCCSVQFKLQLEPKIQVTDRDEGDNARIKVICTTKEKGSDTEACATFRIVTDMVRYF